MPSWGVEEPAGTSSDPAWRDGALAIYFGWRPNLADESDNHLIQWAVAGGAAAVVTKNVKDFRRAELSFAGPRILKLE